MTPDALDDAHALPEEKKALFARARRLEWATIAVLASIVVVVGLSMGSSQAMKTAWAEDLLSLVPPICFLVAARFRHRRPNARFPFGFHRSMTLAFLGASMALTAVGALLFFDGASSLIRAERPTIGTMRLFGQSVWQGWIMVAAAVYGGIPPVILGRMKRRIAPELHDKALHADAAMNSADWQTAVATLLGVIGIGAGVWWADGAAALVISASILWDGARNTKQVFADLMDQTPYGVERAHPLDVPARLEDALRALPWVRDARARLRENGHLFMGDVTVVPTDERAPLLRSEEAQRCVRAVDWRLRDVVVVFARAID